MKLQTTSAALAVAIAFGGVALAQGTLADYERAQGLQAKARGLVVNQPGAANWIGESDRFWYAKTVRGGSEFVLVDAVTAVKKPPFDHDKLAAAINAVTGGHFTGTTLPFIPATGGRGGAGGGRGAAVGPPQTSPLTFKNNDQTIEFGTGGSLYTCQLAGYTCAKGGAIPLPAAGRGNGAAVPGDDGDQPMPLEIGGDPVDGLEWQPFPQQGGAGGRNGSGDVQPPCAPARRPQAPAGSGGRGGRGGATTATAATVGSQILGQVAGPGPDVCSSFDGKWDAFIENYNVFLRPAGAEPAGTGRGNNPRPAAIALSFDGSEGNYYTLRSIAWSPDSKKLAAYHTRPGYDRQVHYIESSPADQLQPKHTTITLPQTGRRARYRLSGALRRGSKKTESKSTTRCFPIRMTSRRRCGGRTAAASPSSTTSAATRSTASSKWMRRPARRAPLIDEADKTFIYYNTSRPGPLGRPPVPPRRERRQGNHLGLGARRLGASLPLRRRHRQGEEPDHQGRLAGAQRGAMSTTPSGRSGSKPAASIPGQDPYFTSTTASTSTAPVSPNSPMPMARTPSTFSPDQKYYVDTWQRVDLPPRSATAPHATTRRW